MILQFCIFLSLFFRCGHCKAPFESEIEVKRHFRQVHSDRPPPPPKCPSTSPPKKPKKKVCEECGVATYALKNHILAFHSDKIFKCDECGKIYNSPYLLKGHINNVSLFYFSLNISFDISIWFGWIHAFPPKPKSFTILQDLLKPSISLKLRPYSTIKWRWLNKKNLSEYRITGGIPDIWPKIRMDIEYLVEYPTGFWICYLVDVL